MTGYMSDAQGLLGNNWLTRAVKKNPEGMLLLGAACALLLRNGGQRNGGQHHSTGYRAGANGSSAGRSFASGHRASMGERFETMVDEVGETARSYGDQVADKASEVSNKASDYMESAQATFRRQTDQLSEQGEALMDRGTELFESNPLMIAAVGFGAGLALAALLPVTEAEEGLIGPATDSLAKKARQIGGKVIDAAKEAGSELKEVAEDKGLDSEGLKEAAGDLADSFSDKLGSDKKGPSSSRPPKKDGSHQAGGPTGSGRIQ
jgi:ElaB/YqjD/DUF883 family membrane-anchored ribosome-binding protein